MADVLGVPQLSLCPIFHPFVHPYTTLWPLTCTKTLSPHSLNRCIKAPRLHPLKGFSNYVSMPNTPSPVQPANSWPVPSTPIPAAIISPGDGDVIEAKLSSSQKTRRARNKKSRPGATEGQLSRSSSDASAKESGSPFSPPGLNGPSKVTMQKNSPISPPGLNGPNVSTVPISSPISPPGLTGPAGSVAPHDSPFSPPGLNAQNASYTPATPPGLNGHPAVPEVFKALLGLNASNRLNGPNTPPGLNAAPGVNAYIPSNMPGGLQVPNAFSGPSQSLKAVRQGGRSRGKGGRNAGALVNETSPHNVYELPSPREPVVAPEGWSEALAKVYKDLLPDDDEQKRREEILEEVQQVVNNCGGSNLPCRLHVYGSFVSGMYSHHSDLDLTVVPLARSPPFGWSADQARACLQRYHAAMKRKGVTTHDLSEMRLRARVPLVVFEHADTRVRCDLSFNNTNGIFKSLVLQGIKKLDPRFPELYMLVKAWARIQGLNDSAEGTFNSWCLAMLVIFYLQTQQTPAILPPLRELFDSREQAQLLANNLDYAQAMTRHRELLDKHVGYGRANTTPVGELFLGFLGCMGSLVDIWLTSRCLRTQARVNVWDGSFGGGSWTREYRMSVEDPFDPNDNCARTIRYEGVDVVKAGMSTTAKALQHLKTSGDVAATISMLFTSRPALSQQRGQLQPAVAGNLPPGAALLAALTAPKSATTPTKQPGLLESLFQKNLTHQASPQTPNRPGHRNNYNSNNKLGLERVNSDRSHQRHTPGPQTPGQNDAGRLEILQQQQQIQIQNMLLQRQLVLAHQSTQQAMAFPQYAQAMPGSPLMPGGLQMASGGLQMALLNALLPPFPTVMNNS